MSMCRVISCVVGRECLLWPVHSLGKTVSLCPASFLIPRPNLPVTCSWLFLPVLDFLLLHSSPLWWKGHLLGVLVLEGPAGLHRNVQLQLLQHYWLEHRLRLLWYWMVCLGNEQRSFCHFWDCTQVLHFFGLFVYLFYFTILYWFCHTLTWIHHRCTWAPKHELPSHLPPHNISLGHKESPHCSP